ncbi:CMRF35-like molecule 5 [Colius striatus]|uniref:CMRF35-like molecule 5 n=1 Tax=Colius striatus TaxID=57412 RepID=UPI002B1E56B2|nr:CMRF35-like molecule 5 [Colius striatus]
MELVPLLVWALLLGCLEVTAPDTVWGFLGGSLSVNCTYQARYKKNPKFWCTPRFRPFTCADDIVITEELQPTARQGRFSIRDDWERRVFTVTVKDLAESDSGTYRCGVRTGIGQRDESADVKVVVLPAPSSSSQRPPYTLTTKHPNPTTSVSVTTQKTPQGESAQSGSNLFNHKGSSTSHLNVVEHILTPGIVVVLLLLAVAAGILVVLLRKRKKALAGAAAEMDRTSSTLHTEANTMNYAEINHGVSTAGSHLYSNTSVHQRCPDTNTEYMELRQSTQDKEAVYARVRKRPPQQEIYANVPSAPWPRGEPTDTV